MTGMTGQRIIIWDLGTLTYVRSGPETLTVSAPGFPELFVASVPKIASDREAVFLALDQLLNDGRIPTRDGLIGVGLYNPLSGEVAVGGVPATVAYSDGDPVPLPEHGEIGHLEQGVLTVKDRQLTPREETWRAVHAAMAAHR